MWHPRSALKAGFDQLACALLGLPVLEAMCASIRNAITPMDPIAAPNPWPRAYWPRQDGTRRRLGPCFWNSCRRKNKAGLIRTSCQLLEKFRKKFELFRIILNILYLTRSNNRIVDYSIRYSRFPNIRTSLAITIHGRRLWARYCEWCVDTTSIYWSEGSQRFSYVKTNTLMELCGSKIH